MKTEQQIEEKMEELIEKLSTITVDVDGEPTKEQIGAIMLGIGWIYCIGWVMDCEEELKEITRTLKLGSAIAKADEAISGNKEKAKKKGR